MRSTKILLNQIKVFEGEGTTTLELVDGVERKKFHAYRCPAGVWTIGYGHTGAAVVKGLTITQEIADDLLRLDVEQVEKQLAKYNLPALTDGQFDAIVDFCFNEGCGKFRGSTLYRKIKANTKDETITREFKRWVYGKVNGKSVVLNGLVKRRNWEVERWQA